MGKQKEKPQPIKESKKIKLKSEVLIKLGVKNQNGRIYEDNENLREMIKDYNERAKTYGGFGELGYPESFDIAFKSISHTVTNVRIKNNAVVGDIEVFHKTNAGRTLSSVIDQCVFRPRAVGTVSPDGEVVLDKIFAFDAINKKEDAFADEDNSESLPN